MILGRFWIVSLVVILGSLTIAGLAENPYGVAISVGTGLMLSIFKAAEHIGSEIRLVRNEYSHLAMAIDRLGDTRIRPGVNT